MESDNKFMEQAEEQKKQSSDPISKVGACIEKDNQIMGKGYNREPANWTGEFPWNDKDKKRLHVVHAVVGAIFDAWEKDLEGATIYVTRFPCYNCAQLIIESKIKRVVYKGAVKDYSDGFYKELNAEEKFNISGVEYISYREAKLILTAEQIK